MSQRISAKTKFGLLLFTIALFSFIIPPSRVLAQSSKKDTIKTNGPQPVRYNQKKLAKDPTSEYYDPNYNTAPVDKVEERYNFYFERVKDPSTGEIPANIRERELQFVLAPSSGLQRSDDYSQLTEGELEQTASGDQQSTWVNRGPYNVGGRTRALAIDMNNENIILAGGVAGGMWRSTDQGTSWIRVTASDQHPGITDVVQDPRVGFQDTWYYSTGERIGASQSARNGAAFYQGNGVYKSTDNGISWTLLPATQNTTPQAFDSPFDLTFGIDIHPTTGYIYVSTFDGIQRSTDGGTTFSEVLNSDFDNFADIHITKDGVIYATLDSDAGTVGSASGIFRSMDGTTWVNITDSNFPSTFGRTVIYSSPSDPDILYVLADGTPTDPVSHDLWKYTYVSGDGTGEGGTWENRSANLPNIGGSVGSFNSQGGYDLFIRVHPTDPDFVLIGGTNIYRSTDGFATAASDWVAGYSPLNNVSLYTNHHPDQHSFVFFPSDPNKVLSGHDGGVSMSTDITATNAGTEPVTWSSLNNGYLTTQIYALSIGPQEQLIAGFQDNSTWFTNNDTPTDPWVDVNSGDGSYNAINSDGTLRYMSSQAGNLRRRTYSDANSTESINSTSLPPVAAGVANGNFLFIAPFEMDPNNDEILYLAQNTNLWRNDNLPNATTTVGWTQMTNSSTSGDISTIGISQSPANVVYIGTTTGEVFRIDGANEGDPEAIDIYTGKGLPATSNVASIDVNPYNAQDVTIAFSNYSVQSIFRSLNGGSSWTNISGNLEENADGSGAGPSVRWVATVGNNDRYFAGTSTGLYSTTNIDGASTLWVQEDLAGIENTVVEQIRARDSDGLVVIGTHGNGMYSANYEVSAPTIRVANVIENVEVEINSTDTEVDLSTVFESLEDPTLPITVSLEDNSNTALVTASLNGNILTLTYAMDASGEATITIKGKDSNGSSEITNFLVTVNPPPVSTFPYVIDFETGSLPDDWEISGAMSWVLNSGETPSGTTGPVADHTVGDSTGVYIYAEATGPNAGDQAFLTSTKIDLSSLTNPIMELHYHMAGTTMGALEVQVEDLTNDSAITTIFSIPEAQQETQEDSYIRQTNLDLSSFGSSVVLLHFVATKGADFSSDIAIDDIQVLERRADDVGVSGIYLTSSTFLSSAETVAVEITNYGTGPQSSFSVSYDLDGGTTVTETFTGTIAGQSTETFGFAATADLSIDGLHTITASTDLSTDAVSENDTVAVLFNNLPIISTFPYLETFEGVTDELPLGWESTGEVLWTLNAGETPSDSTGPGMDQTLGDNSGTYIYAESSGPAVGDEGYFTTAAFDLSQLSNPSINFWYHMFGADMGILSIVAIDFVNDTETEIFTISGEQQSATTDAYTKAKVDLLGYSFSSSSLVQFKFIATNGAGFLSDIALDDIEIKKLATVDLAITDIIGKTNIVSDKATEVTVEITNLGIEDQSGFDITYQVPGQNLVTETITEILTSGASMVYTFNTTFTATSFGDLVYDVAVNITGDEDESDNQGQFETFVFKNVDTFPYVESFEEDNTGWFTEGVNNSFEVGVPTNTLINSASDGDQAWVTNLTDVYNNEEESYVVSPAFDLTALTNPVVFLDINYIIEADYDGAILQYSTDFGESWANVGTLNNDVNWYNSLNLGSLDFASNSTDSWSGDSQGYVTAGHTLDGLSGESAVVLRVVFAADEFVDDEGIGFDNIKLFDLPAISSKTATEVGFFSFVANWDATDQVTEYKLDVSADGFSTFVTDYESRTVDTKSALVVGLEPGVTYEYRVRAYSGAVLESENFNAINTTTNDVFTLNPLESISTNSFTLSWEEVADATQYFVDVASDETFGNLIIDGSEVTTTTFEITGLEAFTTYYARVKASDGTSLSSYTNTVSGTTLVETPLAPNDLSADGSIGFGILLSWTDNSDTETGFVVERSEDDITFSTLAITTENAVNYFDTTAVTGTSYTYRVSATNEAEMSTYITISAMNLTVPEAPSDLVADDTDGLGVTLSWSDNSDSETGFVVERSEDETVFSELTTIAEDVIAFIDETAEVGINYTYRIAANNAAGTSAYSNTATYIITALSTDELIDDIKILPNPSTGVYNLKTSQKAVRAIYVWRTNGKLVVNKSFDSEVGLNDFMLDISNEDAGLYLLRIDLENDTKVVRKLIKK